MGASRPELSVVKQTILKYPTISAVKIAELAGLIPKYGYEDATRYARRVRHRMQETGQLEVKLKTDTWDEVRLEDLKRLAEKRKGRMPKAAAYNLLLLNCYYRLRSKDDNINWTAIDNTYELNASLRNPFPTSEAIKICELATEKYMDSINEEKNEAARKKGHPNAGLNYSPTSLYYMLDIREDELPLLDIIKKPDWY